MNSQFEATTLQQNHGPGTGTSAHARRDWMNRMLLQLEPAVGASIAIATGWLAANSFPGLPWLWAFGLFALAVGFWAGLRRPTGQAGMAARALLLLAAAYVLHAHAGVPGGAAGVFFFWLGIPALFYAFVLLGALSRKPAQDHGNSRIDSSTSLYNRRGLLAHGKVLLESCRRERRELTLAVFDCSDLLEARKVYGSRTSRKLIDSIIRKLKLLAGDRGLAARTGPTQFAVAMPMGRDKAVQLIERVLGNPARIELDGGKSEIVLVPNVMVETVAENASVERLFAALCRGLSRLEEEEQKRQRYLQRERERHSKPMPLRAPSAGVPAVRPASPPRLGPDPVVHQLPNTIPMPLASR